MHGAIDAFAPILDPMVDQFRNPTFTSSDQNNAITFTTSNGFNYIIDHSRVGISFQHRLKAYPVSGGPPRMELLSKAAPYTELLPEVSQRLVEAARLLPSINNRKIFQVGVVSLTRVALDDVPPGIAKFISYMSRPWRGAANAYSFDIVSDFEVRDHWRDRCQHKITRLENPEELMTLSFDYMRRFSVGQATTQAQMQTLINKCSEDALAYFEALAEGDMFDERIIDGSTVRA
jgi:hypothetical protein